MNQELYLFYILSSFALVSAIMVICLSNAVHSVLFLITVFSNIIGILVLLGAEFLAFLLLIVYVGAIAVLFLFVVMMLNVKVDSNRINTWSVFLAAFLLLIILMNQFLMSISTNFDQVNNFYYINYVWTNWFNKNIIYTNTEAIGNVLYTNYSFVFLMSGFILLIAMIGTIVLTMHQRSDVRKQIIAIQLSRSSSNVINFVKLRG
uniref:NADH-ubiquinone oxidoreductase chain 6 n=1 Tax=Sirodotia delicatula TaxID=386631 RepID=A0A343UY44_9FLOR|nr:NADH dehydrogenase subunit 6 [Sirodotia delicatula]AVK39601.1 NADH dehydrogenase subunit 6 [Sirodotia delicatula]